MPESDDRKRILLIASNPSDTESLSIPKEFREIEQGIDLAKNHDLFDIKQTGATRYKDLRRKLLKYQPHIVHFSGHGAKNGILLEDDNGNTQQASYHRLADLLKLTDQVECVILNACDSQTTAKVISQNIDYAIGMNAPIADPSAIEFSVGFYDGIGDGRTYEDAFKFGLNAISNDAHSARRSLNPPVQYSEPTPIPELFSKQETESTQKLTKNEQDFVSQVFSQLNQGVPQVILSQEGRDTAHMAQQLKQFAHHRFADERILHIYPPSSPKASESAYFRRLGRQCRFEEACHDSTEWAGLLEEMLYDGEPLFLLITDFEKGADESRRALASELRQLQEIYSQQLKIIVFGGEKLAEQVFVAGDLSFLNHANTQYVPELELHDLKESQSEQPLDETILNSILTISGGHPLLARHLMINANNQQHQDYQQTLEQSTLPGKLFTRYKQVTDTCDKICSWLQQETIREFEDWPMDQLLRDLYWSNLLMRKNGMFSWRCEVIRDMGRKVLGC